MKTKHVTRQQADAYAASIIGIVRQAANRLASDIDPEAGATLQVAVDGAAAGLQDDLDQLARADAEQN